MTTTKIFSALSAIKSLAVPRQITATSAATRRVKSVRTRTGSLQISQIRLSLMKCKMSIYRPYNKFARWVKFAAFVTTSSS